MSVDKMTEEMKPRNLYRLTTIDTLSADEMSFRQNDYGMPLH